MPLTQPLAREEAYKQLVIAMQLFRAGQLSGFRSWVAKFKLTPPHDRLGIKFPRLTSCAPSGSYEATHFPHSAEAQWHIAIAAQAGW